MSENTTAMVALTLLERHLRQLTCLSFELSGIDGLSAIEAEAIVTKM